MIGRQVIVSGLFHLHLLPYKKNRRRKVISFDIERNDINDDVAAAAAAAGWYLMMMTIVNYNKYIRERI